MSPPQLGKRVPFFPVSMGRHERYLVVYSQHRRICGPWSSKDYQPRQLYCYPQIKLRSISCNLVQPRSGAKSRKVFYEKRADRFIKWRFEFRKDHNRASVNHAISVILSSQRRRIRILHRENGKSGRKTNHTDSHGISIPQNSTCYYNCQTLAFKHHDLIYVEGYAMPNGKASANAHDLNLPLSHAWLMDRDGQAIDPTWETPGAAYFGVPLATSWVESFLLCRGRRDDLSIFDGNHLEDYSLLKQGLSVEAIVLLNPAHS